MSRARPRIRLLWSSALTCLAVDAVAGEPAADPAAAIVDLGQVCRGLPARGRASVTLTAARPAATRRIRSGSPATQLLLSLAPVDRTTGRYDLDVVLLPAREGRIARALDLPGSPPDGSEQVRIRAQVVECGVPVSNAQELALFLQGDRPATRAPTLPERSTAEATQASAAMSRGPALPLFAPDRRRAIEERRRWCEARTDPYDTLYKGSGFVPLPWLSQPGWVYVSTEYDQSPPVAHQRAVWTHARALRSSDWPRYQAPTWRRVASVHTGALPHMQPIGPYTIDDCRLRIWDDYAAWAAAQDDGFTAGAAPDKAPAAGAGSTAASGTDPD